MPLIKKGIKEILQGKDENWAGADGNAIFNGLKQTGEAFLGAAANTAIGIATDFIADVSPFGKKDNNYANIGDPEKKGGGVHEYGMYKDMAKARGYGFTDGKIPNVGGGGLPGLLAGVGIAQGVGAYAADTEQRVWDVEILEPQIRINSVLEERSYLDFYFPNTRLGSGDGIRRIAFFENARIREDRSSRYASQNVIARNEAVRLFTGADARKLKVDFTYTLPHVEYFFRLCNTAALAGFMNNNQPTDAASVPGIQGQPLRGGSHWDHQRFVKAYLDKFFGTSFEVRTDSVLSFKNDDRITGPRAYEPHLQEPKDGYNNNKTADDEERILRRISKNNIDLRSDGMMATYYTQFVIDTIRASVVGDRLENGGAAGPPIVRFRHGSVFNEAPFIVKNFSIDYPTDKGFEFRTLMPRQVKFSLTLEEFHQTHGSHHGDINELVPDASQIVDLVIETSSETLPLTDRRRGLGG